MVTEKRAAKNRDVIRLPDLAEIESDDLGLISVIASRRCVVENREGLHIKPASTISNLSEPLWKDYGILCWLNHPDGRKALSSDILAINSLAIADGQEIDVDMRGPRVLGVEKLDRVLDVFARMLRDSERLENIEALPYIRDARKILGPPLR